MKSHHLIYPLSLVLGITIVMDSFNIHPKDAEGGFIFGVLATYISCLLVYWAYGKEE